MLTQGEWSTFLALILTESRLINIKGDWAPDELGGWFRVRVGEELTLYTGLTKARQYQHLKTLEQRWHLIEARVSPDRRFTRVHFEKATIEALGYYCIPRLAPYEGGIAGVKSPADGVFYWLRPDAPGFQWSWGAESVARMVEGVFDRERPDPKTIRKIMAGMTQAKLKARRPAA